MAILFAAVVALTLACVNVKPSCGAVLNIAERKNSAQSVTVVSTEKILETIESLAASRILMDETSPHSLPSYKSVLPEVTTVKAYMSKEVASDKLTEDVIHSPLHVAQCRATCLEKFIPETLSFQNAEADETAAAAAGKMDEMLLVPNLFKLNRKRRSTGSNKFSSFSSTACFQHSSECLPCWESCQLFEMKPFPAAATACSTSDSQQPCVGGCQVACSFYELLLAKDHDSRNANTIIASANPVVATKQESVLKIEKGKLTWPALSFDGNDQTVTPVVYVVIQEYPDRKWRQIAQQTTELELQIPSQLSKLLKAKYQSVRVLAVGQDGLHKVYSAFEGSTKSQAIVKALKAEFSESSSTSTIDTIPITTEGNDSSFVNVNDVSESSANDGNVAQASSQEESETIEIATPPPPQPSDINAVTTTDKPFVLRLVSLIHQKSLVIAELRWNENGDNHPTQDYLITWELAGGGLKGHLVTDSTSVTLSLWPDATYQIQVAQFTQSLDSDGEQPENGYSNPTTSFTSLPLFVDTSVASFPLEPPSALLGSKMTYEDSNEDELEEMYEQQHHHNHRNGEKSSLRETQDDGDKQPIHKFSVKVFCIAFASLVLVLLVLTLAAYIYLKFGGLLAPKKSCEKLYQDELDECGSSSDSEYYGASGYMSSCYFKEKNCKQLPQEHHHHCCSEEAVASNYYSSVYLHNQPHVFEQENDEHLCRYNSKSKLERGRGIAEYYNDPFSQSGYTDFHCYQDEEIEKSVYSEAPPVPPLAVISSFSALSSLAVPEERVNRHPTAQGSLFDSYHNNSSNYSNSTLFNCSSSSRAHPARHGGLQEVQ